VGRWRTRFTADAGQTVHPDFEASLAGPLRFPLHNLAVDFVAPPTGGPTGTRLDCHRYFLVLWGVMALIAGTRTRIWVAPGGAQPAKKNLASNPIMAQCQLLACSHCLVA